jgi:hydroxypyruvate isomerase
MNSAPYFPIEACQLSYTAGGWFVIQRDLSDLRQVEMNSDAPAVTRRHLLQASAMLGQASAAEPKRVAKNGRINHSVVFWCFSATDLAKWDLDQTCRIAKSLGCKSVELVKPQYWPVIKKHGLACALAPNGMPDPPFIKGIGNPRYHEEIIATTRQTIEKCADFGVPSVIAFMGTKWRDATDPASGVISPVDGANNAVKALRALARDAERRNITVCLEMLNSRDTSHVMKGVAGYQGADLDYCAEIVRRVNSPRVKLLFDIFHVQIMNGDVIRRIRQYPELIAHVHTAGNPGRGELDDKQELHYPAIMRALVEVGYKGYVGHEFIPTRDPLAGLMEAVATCDV